MRPGLDRFNYFNKSRASPKKREEADFKCPNCNNLFNGEDRIPLKMRKCDHTICLDCLKEKITKRSVTCPIDG